MLRELGIERGGIQMRPETGDGQSMHETWPIGHDDRGIYASDPAQPCEPAWA
jgi:hypothetical protein